MADERAPTETCPCCGGVMIWSRVRYVPAAGAARGPDGEPLGAWVGTEACCREALRSPGHPCRVHAAAEGEARQPVGREVAR